MVVTGGLKFRFHKVPTTWDRRRKDRTTISCHERDDSSRNAVRPARSAECLKCTVAIGSLRQQTVPLLHVSPAPTLGFADRVLRVRNWR